MVPLGLKSFFLSYPEARRFRKYRSRSLLLRPPGEMTGDGPTRANALFGFGGRANGFGFIAAADAVGFIARLIRDLQAAGRTSLRAIAEGLNEAGIPTARGQGSWSAVQVQRVLERL
jgi:Recombinase